MSLSRQPAQFTCWRCLSRVQLRRSAQSKFPRVSAKQTHSLATPSRLAQRASVIGRRSLPTCQLPGPQLLRRYALISNQSSNLRNDLAQDAPLNRPAGITQLTHRSLLSIIGPDASKFLQGLATNSITAEKSSGILYTGLLNAQGRVLSDAFVYPRKDSQGRWYAFVEVDASLREAMYNHFSRHKLRSRVKIQRVDNWSVWALWSDGRQDHAEWNLGQEQNIDVAADPRLHAMGYRILAEGSAVASALSEGSSGSQFRHPSINQIIPVVPLESYHVRRYLHGIPEGPMEIIQGSALPLETNMDYMQGIDFKKGCYVGQELTIRTKHTGVVRKRILPVKLYEDGAKADAAIRAEDIPAATSIKRINAENVASIPTDFELTGRETGKFLSGIGKIGLALCRLEHMTKHDVEFGMNWSSERQSDAPTNADTVPATASIRIRALVPQWHELRRRELERKGQNQVESVEELQEKHLQSAQPPK